ncbi:hypothetical protein BDN72DRAFT_863811 [Pluteus cervinus]|uniref:Uncharacterized protein n=1 Tax=Pluteus cervinus TaxID=181527 RepID=A0ACD3A6Z1_9AGAR|nr:hypothetical protein BDN72DRAFT_863811 [Pluteus cervinus]
MNGTVLGAMPTSLVILRYERIPADSFVPLLVVTPPVLRLAANISTESSPSAPKVLHTSWDILVSAAAARWKGSPLGHVSLRPNGFLFCPESLAHHLMSSTKKRLRNATNPVEIYPRLIPRGTCFSNGSPLVDYGQIEKGIAVIYTVNGQKSVGCSFLMAKKLPRAESPLSLWFSANTPYFRTRKEGMAFGEIKEST